MQRRALLFGGLCLLLLRGRWSQGFLPGDRTVSRVLRPQREAQVLPAALPIKYRSLSGEPGETPRSLTSQGVVEPAPRGA